MFIWLHRSFAVTLLTFGSLNAVSYFVRSVDGGNLLGTYPDHSEALGFPWILAEHHSAGPDWVLDFVGFYKNLGAGVVTWLIVAAITLANRRWLDRLEQDLKATAQKVARPKKVKWQFSLRGLLVLMAVSAVVALGISMLLRGRWEVLAALYAFGPWFLVGLAYIPAKISWQQRVAIIIPLTLILISLTVVAGSLMTPPLEFDKTLMGVFVCWTPQAGLAAIGLALLFLGLQLWRKGKELAATPAVPSVVESAHPPAG